MSVVAAYGVVGILHPGEMGAAVGRSLVYAGYHTLWSSSGRSAATRQRAANAGLEERSSVDALVAECSLIISICPPAAALDVAGACVGFQGVYVDANAISPSTSLAVRDMISSGGGRYVDASIIGGPPDSQGNTRLYLSGPLAASVSATFAGTWVDARVVSRRTGDASALKMAYALWTKGQIALLLATYRFTEAIGLQGALARELALSQPELGARHEAAVDVADRKAWRWVGEMNEIAKSFSDAGVPDGFPLAAADIFHEHNL